MRHFTTKEIVAVCVTALTAVSAAISSTFLREQIKDDGIPDTISAVIQVDANSRLSKGLRSGYNYHLLSLFAESHDASPTILISRDKKNWADSLRTGAIDILVYPFGSDCEPTDFSASGAIDSISIWMTAEDSKRLSSTINFWLSTYLVSESHTKAKDMFLNTFDPLRYAKTGKKKAFLGPYDDLIKSYSKELGWDWRLLAAVVYQESHFKIHARSQRGAMGLMQIMPSSTDVPPELLIDPEINLRTGTEYLKMLYKRYINAENQEERQKFTLAAYNAGGGRIHQLIQCANSHGISTGTWDSVMEAIDHMDNFKGTETIRYVDNIFLLYDAFKVLCP